MWWIAPASSSRGARGITRLGTTVPISPHLKGVRPLYLTGSDPFKKLGGGEDREDVGEGGDDVGRSGLDERGGVSVAVDADPDSDAVLGSQAHVARAVSD